MAPVEITSTPSPYYQDAKRALEGMKHKMETLEVEKTTLKSRASFLGAQNLNALSVLQSDDPEFSMEARLAEAVCILKKVW